MGYARDCLRNYPSGSSRRACRALLQFHVEMFYAQTLNAGRTSAGKFAEYCMGCGACEASRYVAQGPHSPRFEACATIVGCSASGRRAGGIVTPHASHMHPPSLGLRLRLHNRNGRRRRGRLPLRQVSRRGSSARPFRCEDILAAAAGRGAARRAPAADESAQEPARARGRGARGRAQQDALRTRRGRRRRCRRRRGHEQGARDDASHGLQAWPGARCCRRGRGGRRAARRASRTRAACG
jgi:hypothetical protein